MELVVIRRQSGITPQSSKTASRDQQDAHNFSWRRVVQTPRVWESVPFAKENQTTFAATCAISHANNTNNRTVRSFTCPVCSLKLPIVMYYRLTIFAIAVLVTVGMALVPTGVIALTFTPERIDTEVYPGVPITEELTLLNETGANVTVALFPVELDLSESQAGRASFRLDTAENPSVAWMSVTPSHLILGPREERNVRVTLTAPDASSGSLLAGIAIEFRPVRSGEEGDIVTNAVTGPFVFARVLSDASVLDGHLNSFRLAEGARWASALPVPVEVTFANTGSVHLKPSGFLDVRDVFGRSVDRAIVNRDLLTVLPSTTRQLPVDWEGVALATEEPFSTLWQELKHPRLGPYTFAATMHYGDDAVITAQRTLLIFPWRSFLILGGALGGIVVARRRLRTVEVHDGV